MSPICIIAEMPIFNTINIELRNIKMTIPIIPPTNGNISGLTNPLVTNLDANGNRIMNLPNPVADGDAATKGYVDSSSGGLHSARTVVTPLQMFNLAESPVEIAPSPGPGKVIFPLSISFYMNGTIPYTHSPALGYFITNSSGDSYVNFDDLEFDTAVKFLWAGANEGFFGFNTESPLNYVDSGVYLHVIGTDPNDGDGDITIDIDYIIKDFTGIIS